jgi:UDPglucose 6-dehydrogenase
MKIGIIGNGYVGSAVAASYPDDKILINDPRYPDISRPIEQLKEKCHAIFVCVPTPSSDSGQCDTTILEQVLESLTGYEGIVIAKSTASPVFYKQMERSLDLKLAHVPEFLTQARAKFDYVNPHKIVVGCRKKIRDQVADVLLASAVNFDRVRIEYCGIAEASYFKYMANCMLAMKVTINNELYDLAQELGLDWEKLSSIAKTDDRLGNTHWAVPGPDGERGYGGACFPKDTAALKDLANSYAVGMPMLSTAIKANKNYRLK